MLNTVSVCFAYVLLLVYIIRPRVGCIRYK